MISCNGKDVFSSIMLCLALYVDYIESISRVKMDWMLSSFVCLHGTHFNGARQGPSSHIYIIN
jgi:hypothetical protein